MDLSDALTLAGATIIIGIVIEAIKRAANWTPEMTGRFAPLLAIFLGAVAITLLTFAQGNVIAGEELQNVATAIITGILSGAAASGLYDGVKVVTGAQPEAVKP